MWIDININLPKPMQPVLTYDKSLKIFEVLCLVDTTNGYLWINNRGDFVKANPSAWKKIKKPV